MAPNETKHVVTEKKLTNLSKRISQILVKGYDFLLGRMYFTVDDGSQTFCSFFSNA